jgi:hypothetical protein
MGAGTVSETLDYNAILARQVTRENFTSLSHRKSLKSYKRWADRRMVNTLTTFYVTHFRNLIHNSRPWNVCSQSAGWITFTQSQSMSLRSHLILSSHLCPWIVNSLCTSEFLLKLWYLCIIPTFNCYMPHPFYYHSPISIYQLNVLLYRKWICQYHICIVYLYYLAWGRHYRSSENFLWIRNNANHCCTLLICLLWRKTREVKCNIRVRYSHDETPPLVNVTCPSHC